MDMDGRYRKEGLKKSNYTNKIARFVDGGFANIGVMRVARAAHACAPFQENLLLVIGGLDNHNNELGSCEIVHVSTGISGAAPTLNYPRANHIAISTILMVDIEYLLQAAWQRTSPSQQLRCLIIPALKARRRCSQE